MNRTIKLALGVMIGSAILGGLPSTAAAQDDILTTIVPSLEFQEADVREALRSLFKAKNVSYSIAPDVQGAVNVSLKNVTFEVALQNITRQVDATYRIEGGVFNIVRRVQEEGPSGLPEGTTLPQTNTKVVRRIKIRAADPQFIAMLIGQANGSQNFTLAPEMSTLIGGMQGGQGGGMGGGMGGGGFGGGGMGGGGFGGGGFGGQGGGGMGGGGFGGRGGGGFGGGGGMGGGRGGF